MQKESSSRFSDFLKGKLEYLVAFTTLVAFIAVSVTSTGLKFEYSMYDTMLKLKPAPQEREDVLLLDIDDRAIEEIGAWPWTRDILADLLIRMAELGGRAVVFDIEYLTPGQSGVNRSYVKDVFPDEYAATRVEVVEYIGQFAEAVADKNIPLNAVLEVSGDMTGYLGQRLDELSSSVTGNIFRDNDVYFSKAIGFFGHAYLTINTTKLTENNDLDEAKAFAFDNLMTSGVSDPAGRIVLENRRFRESVKATEGITPAILVLLQNVAGAGFPNVIIDNDGIRRRVDLLAEYQGKYFGQLVFAPILNILDPESIVRDRYALILKNALDPSDPDSGKRADLKIPLDEDGHFVINWLKKTYNEGSDPQAWSFKHLSSYDFTLADEMEQQLIDNLSAIEALNVKTAEGYLGYHDAVLWLRASWKDLAAWKVSLLDGERDDFSAYFDARKEFFDNYGQFLSGGYDTEIYDTVERVIAAGGDPALRDFEETVKANFTVYNDQYKGYVEHVATLQKVCAGSFSVIGNSATGTSDLGNNPFWQRYQNVGTHANIYNTIMTRQFITPVPRWGSWIIAFGLALVSALAFRRIKSLRGRIVYGLLSMVAVFAVIAAIMAFTRVYIQLFVPLMTVAFTFLLVSILRFVFSEQEKSFLRKAFTMYLSSDVVNQIVADPSLLKLGGQEKHITALFTDIKSFSTLSEKVTPEHLVEILNRYLTLMSDIVLEQKGTIDKYIGDAIVSFFGAPIDLSDHASRACLAAVRMKQAEKTLNDEMMASGFTPMPVYTRIGINTGPMVVGNMGTDNKMNYTIMGNDVNLAARLEGVNKQYGTWILVSEMTWNATNGMFLGRKLDRVRVVGIETPVQLYNIMGVRAEASGRQVALADKFNEAIDAYREKRFGDALHLFSKCAELDPDDDATRIFLDKIRGYIKNGVPADWTDIVNMTSK